MRRKHLNLPKTNFLDIAHLLVVVGAGDGFVSWVKTQSLIKTLKLVTSAAMLIV